MLEIKRKRVAGKDFFEFERPKRLCYGVTNCMAMSTNTLKVSPMESSFPAQDSISDKLRETMKIDSSTIISQPEKQGMEVDEAFDSTVERQDRSPPRCALCAAGAGGHFTHMMR